MRQPVDPETWSRKDHFAFFSAFEEPFFGITVEVDCTEAHARAKQNMHSFFLYYLHCSLAAANAVEAFRYRISEGTVWRYDVIHASPTILRPDGTFGFSYMDFDPDFTVFAQKAKAVMDTVQQSRGLTPSVAGENVIHYSAIPWIRFTALSHARRFGFADSAPKISFGKMVEENGRLIMPMSVHAHHGLVDGLHVGQYVDLFQAKLHSPES